MKARDMRPDVASRLARGRVSFAVAACIAAWTSCGGPQEARWSREAREMLPELARLANLEVKAEPIVRETDAEGLRRYLEARLEENFPGDLLDRIAATYVWLGLLPDTLDLRALLVELYQEQAIGFYDPRDDAFYVRRDAPRDAVAPVLAHELVHALQDQHVDLDSIITDLSDNDRHTAAQAAIEGHATLAMFAWQLERQSGRPIEIHELPDLGALLEGTTAAAGDGMPVLARAPRLIRESLVFPYVQGVAYVQDLWRRAPERPPPFGEHLPLSTEEILHGDGPPPLDVRWTAGPVGWEPLYENGLGELEIRIFLEEHLADRPGAQQAAAGWSGDRFSLFVAHEGRDTVFAWLTAWDSERDAAEFEAAYRRAAALRFGAGDPAAAEIAGPGGWARVDPVDVAGGRGRRIVEARRALAVDVVRALRHDSRPAAF